MRWFAIDIGESTGWARALDRARPTWGVEQMPETGDDLGATGVALENFLRFQFNAVARPDVVIYARSLTQTRPGQSAQMKKLGMAMVLETVCYRQNITLIKAWEATMRKSFLAPAKVPRRSIEAKAAVMARCAGLGWSVQDHNASDALCVLDYARAQHFPGWRSPAERSGLFAKSA